jgi:hypothetical protein
MAHRLTGLLACLVLLAACGEEIAFDPAGPGSAGSPTAPGEPGAPGPAAEPHPDAIWFEVLAVTETGGAPGIELAESAEELADLWERHGLDGPVPDPGFDTHVVALALRFDNSCPEEVVEVRLVDAELKHTLLGPPGPCTDVGITWAYAIAYHRGDLPEEVTVRLRDITATFTLPPYDGPPAPAPSPPPQQMDEAELDAVFADHPIRRCDELPDPRDEFLSRDRPAADHTPAPMDESVPADLQGAYAAEHADTFGWLMVLQDEGVWVVGVTDDVEGHRERLAARHPGSTFRVDETPHAQRDLEAAQQAILPLHGAEEGPELVTSSFFTHLELGIIDPTREDLDAIAELVDPELACVEPVLSGLEPRPAG